MKKILFVILLALFIPFFSVSADTDFQTNVYIFTQQGCPYCAKSLALLENLKQTTNPEIVIHEFDLKNDPSYYTKFIDFSSVYEVSTNGVPVTFIDKIALTGFDESGIREKIESCALPVTNCIDPEDYVIERIGLYSQNNVNNGLNNDGTSKVGWAVTIALVFGAGFVIYLKIK